MTSTATIGRRIPQSLAQLNIEAFKPEIVSIGPCYHEEPKVQSFLKHKLSFLDFFTTKVEEKGIDFKQVEEAVSNLQGIIIGSYSKDIDLPSITELVKMMILDGSFILMLFTVFCGKVSGYPAGDDEIFKNPSTLQSIRRDLLLLGNQVPYVVLQTLFQTSKLVTSCGLNEMVFKFFGNSLYKPDTFWEKHSGLQASNLLDLIRQTFIPAVRSGISTNVHDNREQSTPEFIFPLSLLVRRGMRFKPKKNSDTILDVSYNNGVLHIPPVVIDAFTASVLSNCLAYEQLYVGSSNHMRSYVALMSCLIKEESDCNFLYERDIIKNCLAPQPSLFQFFKSIGQGIGTDIVIDPQQSYLKEVFQGVNKYRKCFKSQWICATACAAFLFTFMMVQIFLAVLPTKTKS